MKEVLHFENIKPPERHYNHIVRAGDFLFISTQIPANLETGEFVHGDVKIQAKQSLDNIRILLERAGANLNDVVKIGIFLADLNDFPAMNETYNEFFPAKENAPTRFTLQTAFPNSDIKVEFEAVAYSPKKI